MRTSGAVARHAEAAEVFELVQSLTGKAVAFWRNCDKPGPIGFVVGGFSGGLVVAGSVAGAWLGANPYLLRAQALALAGWRGAATEHVAKG
jgi:hypothetical protein